MCMGLNMIGYSPPSLQAHQLDILGYITWLELTYEKEQVCQNPSNAGPEVFVSYISVAH